MENIITIRRLIIINIILIVLSLAIVIGGFRVLFQRNAGEALSPSLGSSAPPSLIPAPLSAPEVNFPSHIRGESPETLTFREYYENLTAARKECVSNVLGENRISTLLATSPILTSISLTPEQNAKLQDCLTK